MNSKAQKLEAFSRLLDIMDELRAECPWDQKQTFESLHHLTLEETYELGDAILEGNRTEIKKELGDLLLHIVFYAKLGSEEKAFDIADIAEEICEKLIFRHPHIYADVKVKDEVEVKKNWEALKLKEGKKSVLQGVPKGLPALIKAQRIQENAAGVGFDWPNKADVLAKFEEEF
ncbi:MAG: nucleoside triphosphate pyrophosphohydrolase, partial [Flavobacteriaceae bacterium]